MHTSQARTPSDSAVATPPRRSTTIRHPSAATGKESIEDTIPPMLPDCQKNRYMERVAAQSIMPPATAPVGRTPAARRDKAPIQGNPIIIQKKMASP